VKVLLLAESSDEHQPLRMHLFSTRQHVDLWRDSKDSRILEAEFQGSFVSLTENNEQIVAG